MTEQAQVVEKLPAVVTAEMLAKEESVFLNVARFEHAQRVARVLAESTMVPDHFRGNVGNCLIALNLAERMQLDPFMLMQSVYIVHGRPGIEGKLAIALIEGHGRFAPLEYECKGSGKTEKGIDRPDECHAYAKDLKTGKMVHGPAVTWSMAVAEGWTKDKGSMPSKWQTLPELMFRYRAATFFGRVNCPGALLGLRTADELEDLTPEINVGPGKPQKNAAADKAREEAMAKFKASIPAPFIFEHPSLQEFLSKLAQANRCSIEDVMVEASGQPEDFWKGYQEYLETIPGNKVPEEQAGPGDPPPPPPPPAENHAAADREIAEKDAKTEKKNGGRKRSAGEKVEMRTCPPDRKFAGKQVATIFCRTSCPDKSCEFSSKERGPREDDF